MASNRGRIHPGVLGYWLGLLVYFVWQAFCV